MNFKMPLTPALSHPMGEGELFSVIREVGSLRLPNDALPNLKVTTAVPSPLRKGRGLG